MQTMARDIHAFGKPDILQKTSITLEDGQILKSAHKKCSLSITQKRSLRLTTCIRVNAVAPGPVVTAFHRECEGLAVEVRDINIIITILDEVTHMT